MRLVLGEQEDADALPVHKAYCVDEAGWGANFYVVDKSDIDEASTIDAVPVVRCKDCLHLVLTPEGEHNPNDCVCNYWMTDGLNDLDFCSYGERRSDADLRVTD